MKTIVWVLYVVLANSNGDAINIVEMEQVFESKQLCTEHAISMRLFPENYGCRPRYSTEQ